MIITLQHLTRVRGGGKGRGGGGREEEARGGSGRLGWIGREEEGSLRSKMMYREKDTSPQGKSEGGEREGDRGGKETGLGGREKERCVEGGELEYVV